MGLLLGCGQSAALPASRPAVAVAEVLPKAGDACFADASEPARAWRALHVADHTDPAPAREAPPFAVDATAFAAPVRLELRLLVDAASDAQTTTILLTVASNRGESRTLQLKTDAGGCRFEQAAVSVTCFEAGASVGFALVRRGATVYVTKQLGDEAEPKPGPAVPYAEVRLSDSAPVQLVELAGEAEGPLGRCAVSQVEIRSL